MRAPKRPDTYTINYKGLKGVDFSVDPSLVSRSRSPDMLNMISDKGGNPIKRRGWEKLHTINEPIRNIWTFVMENKRWYIVATDTKIIEYKRETGFEGMIASTCAKKGAKLGFFFNSATHAGFYIMDGEKYYVIKPDKDNLKVEEVKAHIPLILIARAPTGGGVIYEGINLLTRERKEQFLNTSGNSTFVLSAEVNTDKPYKAQYKNAEGVWTDTTMTVTGAKATLGTSAQPVVTGEDNISIQYFAKGEDSQGKILNCSNFAFFTEAIVDRIFVTGNPKLNQNVWYSELGDPTYFPDLNYLSIGGSETRSVGLISIGEYLAVLKEPNGINSTTYLIYRTKLSTKTTIDAQNITKSVDEYTFAVKQATAGTGAIANRCMGVLNDEPVYLSNNGVSGIVSTITTGEKVTRNRSGFVDQKLMREPNLKDAIGIVFDNYFMVFVNGHVYILDGRQMASSYNKETNYLYEAYYWDNVPAIAICNYENEIMFGTEEGYVCRFFNTGTIDDYNDDGAPILARWTTTNDDDAKPQFLKNMSKKGSAVTVAPSKKSSVDVYYSKDSVEREFIGRANVDTWEGFTEIEFDRFAFDTRTGPRDVSMRKKIKGYQRLTLIFENNVVNESFGIFQVIKTYEKKKYAR